MGDLTRVVTIVTRPRHSQFLLLLLSHCFLECLLRRQKAITFSSKIFQTLVALRLPLCFYNMRYPLQAGYSTFFFAHSTLPPIRVIRKPLDLFHFVVLFARCYCFTYFGGKLDCSENKLLIKQIDTRTHNFSYFAHTPSHDVSTLWNR